MTAPPGLAADPLLFGEHITGTRHDLSTRNGQLRYLVAELGVERRQAQALIRAYELDRRDPLPLSASITAAEIRESMAEDFREWATHRVSRLSACDQRIGGPNWRTAT